MTHGSAAAAMLDEFRTAYRRPTANVPDRGELLITLLREEVDELEEAIASGDPVRTAHELADVLYVGYYIASVYRLPVDVVLEEVHRANMSKLDDDGNPILRADGKVLKGPNYRPPDVTRLLTLAGQDVDKLRQEHA